MYSWSRSLSGALELAGRVFAALSYLDVFIYLTLAFSLWMLIDAIRRSAPGYWVLVIIFFAPLGALVYFFAVKFSDYRPWLRRLLEKRSNSIEELMARYETSPSLLNQMALAHAYYEAERFEQAASLFSDVLEKKPVECDALWGLARVRRSQGNYADSLRLYERLLEQDARHGDFAAVLEYAETLWDGSRRDRAIEVLEDIASESSRLNHRLALAHYLVLAGNGRRAKEVLKLALKDHETSPKWLQQKQRQWAKAAGELLEKLDSA